MSALRRTTTAAWGRVPRTVRRFATVGLVNTAIDLALFWVLQDPLGVLAANFLSTSAGMAFSFVANGHHTFGTTRLTLRQAALFVATNGVTMWLLQPGLIALGHDAAGLPVMVAKIGALAGSVVANYLLYRFVVFTERPVADAGASRDLQPAGRA